MFTRHVSRQLAALIDGELAPQKAHQVESHATQCARCRAERDQVSFGMEILEQLPLVEAPDAIWVSIEAALEDQRSRKTWAIRWWRLAFAASLVLALAAGAYWTAARQSGMRWEVVRLDGAARHVGAGEWIETDSRSSATVKVGRIGSVEVAPNTRMRVVTARPGEHRLALARGEIRAKISAPPRLFFVDTASGTAVDLGCEYTLNTDEDGLGLLRVTKGWVSFQWKGLESLVPAGASCRTQPDAGPGIPYFDDAPESMKQALGNNALDVILAEARPRDTLTLWHLLFRVELEDRARVYDRMASLTPIPAGVSREQALKLDPETLKRWKEELAWTW
jgi:predicted anti-sigma-YlaC factor YlaD